MFSLQKCILNGIMKKIEKEAQKATGYDVNLRFNDPIRFKIKDGAVQLHLNIDGSCDIALLKKAIEEWGEGSE